MKQVARVGCTVKFMFALWKERGESLYAVKGYSNYEGINCFKYELFSLLSRKHTKLGDCMNDVDEREFVFCIRLWYVCVLV